MYLVADVHKDGTIRVGPDAGWLHVVHKESTQLHEKYLSCVDELAKAKELWGGPDGDSIILELSKDGSCNAVWMTDSQRERLIPQLNKWKGCYGLWPVKHLNS